jgi:hypothetical protein
MFAFAPVETGSMDFSISCSRIPQSPAAMPRQLCGGVRNANSRSCGRHLHKRPFPALFEPAVTRELDGAAATGYEAIALAANEACQAFGSLAFG